MRCQASPCLGTRKTVPYARQPAPLLLLHAPLPSGQIDQASHRTCQVTQRRQQGSSALTKPEQRLQAERGAHQNLCAPTCSALKAKFKLRKRISSLLSAGLTTSRSSIKGSSYERLPPIACFIESASSCLLHLLTLPFPHFAEWFTASGYHIISHARQIHPNSTCTYIISRARQQARVHMMPLSSNS